MLEIKRKQRVMVVGGAGFIGRHLVELLLSGGYEVAVVDCLHAWSHGYEEDPATDALESFAKAGAEIYDADIADGALAEIKEFRPNCVVNLAGLGGHIEADICPNSYLTANVSTAQALMTSMLRANDSVTDAADAATRYIVSSSVHAYGFGMAECPEHGAQRTTRDLGRLLEGDWESHCLAAKCDEALRPVGIPEWASHDPIGMLGLTDVNREHIAMFGARAGLSVAALRMSEVIGPDMRLGSRLDSQFSRLLARVFAGQPRVREDGQQVLDLVHVADVARAFQAMIGPTPLRLARRHWANPSTSGIFNVSSGIGLRAIELAELATSVVHEEPIEVQVSGEFCVTEPRALLADPREMGERGWMVEHEMDTEGLAGVIRQIRAQSAIGPEHLEVLDALDGVARDRGLLLHPAMDHEAAVSKVETSSGWVG